MPMKCAASTCRREACIAGEQHASAVQQRGARLRVASRGRCRPRADMRHAVAEIDHAGIDGQRGRDPQQDIGDGGIGQ